MGNRGYEEKLKKCFQMFTNVHENEYYNIMNDKLMLNKYELDILFFIKGKGLIAQREISDYTNMSLGQVNKCIKSLKEKGFVDMEGGITKNAWKIIQKSKSENAIILAAGYGLRMAPIHSDCPKGLLEIKGQIMIERIITQMKEVGINTIYIVVGYKKEKFEYLIDKYGVELICNMQYGERNNLHSLFCAAEYIGNSYIVPCDIWCTENPFKPYEPYSWYMVTDEEVKSSSVIINRTHNLTQIDGQVSGNKMLGIAYIDRETSGKMIDYLKKYDGNHTYDEAFWEEALFEGGRMYVSGRVVKDSDYAEINTYEELRELDENSNNLKSEAIQVICETFGVYNRDITDIELLKKGMTNRSFLFKCREKRYIMRIPGEGTEQLISRSQEGEVYNAIRKYEISDRVAYLSKKNGYKITEYIENARVCDPFNEEDVKKCMKRLREFHNMSLKVTHEFDIFRQIEYYQGLWQQEESVFKDYQQTKENVFQLKQLIDNMCIQKCLTHIDAVPDNFLIFNLDGAEKIALIDWEYAGMQDPHVDIAMFAIYSLYDKLYVDKLIDIYFEGKGSKDIRLKIYCYIAACGLLWSNWCEYKRQLGVEFGEYSIRQYRYAKDYYRYVQELIKNE